MTSDNLNAKFHEACMAFVLKDEHILPLNTTLDNLAKELAQSHDTRKRMGSDEPEVWTDLRQLWQDLARKQLTSVSGENEAETSQQNNISPLQLRSLCASLAKFTRNIVAGVPENQSRAFENEPDVRRLLHYYTSWSAMKDDGSFPVTRVLTQTVSNMVTSNESLKMQLWETYMNLPEDQVVLLRLLASPDARTVLAVLVLILNCIHSSALRAKMLSTTTIGARICISLLDNMVSLYDAEEASDGSRAFDVGYDIFMRLITEHLVPDLYDKLTIADEIVTPHQTTLLKLVDSYLQSIQLTLPKTTPKITRIHGTLRPLLSEQFLALSAYAQQAIQRSLRSTKNADNEQSEAGSPTPTADSSSASSALFVYPPSELDVMLPKVCEALVLVTQCIITITLDAEKSSTSPTDTEATAADFFNGARFADQGFVESLIELLRLLNVFLPRINFGKPVESPTSPDATPTTATSVPPVADPTGFSYLKRDLVRLLGILCHETKSAQDRVRICGGIPVVMNLCVVDERNPYLREHAIFTLRNLLHHNAENQAIVESIKPSGKWDDDGVLRDDPDAIRR